MSTAVFWDLENCRANANTSGHTIVDGIRRIVQGSFADASIYVFKAYADLSLDIASPRALSLHSELQSSGVSLVHCPHNGRKDVADKMMLVDMMLFALDYPPPGAVVIISGDRDFSYAASTLRNRKYRIIVVGPTSTTHATLKYQADRFFDWQKDVLHCEGMPNSRPKSRSASEASPVRNKALSRPSLPLSSCSTICKLDGEAGVHLSCPPEKEDSHVAAPPYDTVSRSWDLLPTHNLAPDSEKIQLFSEDASKDSQGFGGLFCTTSMEPEASEHSAMAADRDGHGSWSSTSATLDLTCEGHHTPQFPQTARLAPSVSAHVVVDDLHCGPHILEVDTANACASDSDKIDDDMESADGSSEMQFPAHDSGVLFSPQRNMSYAEADSHGSEMCGRLKPNFSFPAKEDVKPQTCDSIQVIERTISTPVSDADRRRFSSLITVFRRNYEVYKVKAIPSATVAASMQKLEKDVYTLAGVTKFKDYVNAARLANVIFSPGLDKDGTAVLEINPVLYIPPLVPICDGPLTRLPSNIMSSATVPDQQSLDQVEQRASFENSIPWNAVSDVYRRRFCKLIVVFNKYFKPNDRTQVPVSEVEFALCRQNPMSFVGFDDPKIKKMLKCAQVAGVIAISERQMLVELNPTLYWTFSTNRVDGGAVHSPEPLPGQVRRDPAVGPLCSPSRVDPIFHPLVGLLRDSWPSEVLRSRIGLQLSNEVYKRASVTRLGEYLFKAVSHGVIDVGTRGPGKEWVRLKAEHNL